MRGVIPRRLPRFGLKAAMFGVVLAAVVFGRWANEARRQREIRRRVESRGGQVEYAVDSSEVAAPAWVRAIIGDELFRPIEGVINLQDRSGLITPEDLGRLAALPGLRRLQLNGEGFDNRHLRPIGRLTSLTELDLQSTRVTDEGLDAISGLRHLDYLSLAETLVEGHGLRHLVAMKSLTDLDLTNTGAGDDDLRWVVRFPSLQRLALGEAITDRGLALLESMTGLNELRLQYSRISEQGVDHLLARGRIRRLGLHYTPVSGADEIQRIMSAYPRVHLEASW